MLDEYQHTAHHADTLIAPYTRPGVPGVATPRAAPDLTRWDDALTWLRTERPNLQACLQNVTTGHTPPHRRPHSPPAWPPPFTTTDPGPRPLNCTTTPSLPSLALATIPAKPTPSTIWDACGGWSAIIPPPTTCYTKVGDRLGQANTLNNLGIVRLQASDYLTAESLFHQALIIQTEIDDHHGQARALHNHGPRR